MTSRIELAPHAARADLRHMPTDALAIDAGGFANAVARIFPRPHAAYFAAEPARRRLMCLVAVRAADPHALAEPLSTWSLKRIAGAFMPDAPEGFVEALKRLDGADWTSERLIELVELLREGGEGAKTLRHAAAIDARLVGTLGALPPALRRPRIVAQIPAVHLAELVAKGAKRIVREQPDVDFGKLAERLERSRSTQGLFRMLIEAIGIERLAPPPIPGAPWLAPIATARAIESAALRFENCLRGRIPMLLAGNAAYYEALGGEPAVVEIVRDGAGLWVVGEVRGHANAGITDGLWAKIRKHLEVHGARVDRRRVDQLALALANAAGW